MAHELVERRKARRSAAITPTHKPTNAERPAVRANRSTAYGDTSLNPPRDSQERVQTRSRTVVINTLRDQAMERMPAPPPAPKPVSAPPTASPRRSKSSNVKAVPLTKYSLFKEIEATVPQPRDRPEWIDFAAPSAQQEQEGAEQEQQQEQEEGESPHADEATLGDPEGSVVIEDAPEYEDPPRSTSGLSAALRRIVRTIQRIPALFRLQDMWSWVRLLLTITSVALLALWLTDSSRGALPQPANIVELLRPARFSSIFTGSNRSSVAHDPPGPDVHRLRTRISELEHSVNTLLKEQDKPPIRRMNYFAPGMGTAVDSFLTSPTRRLSAGHNTSAYLPTLPNPFRKLLLWSPFGHGGGGGGDGSSAWSHSAKWHAHDPARTGRGASSVFGPWEDSGECWCSPDGGGRSQIAVVMAVHVIPREIVVEHIAAEATVEAPAMPRDMELWVPVDDPAVRLAVARDFNDTYPSRAALLDDEPLLSRAEDANGAPRALDDTWVRVARWRFDLRGPESQSFPVPVDLANFNAPAKRVVIRTTSTWGASGSVCLYRLKLHGLLALRQERYFDEATGTELRKDDGVF